MKDISILRQGVIDKITNAGQDAVEAKEKANEEELSSYRAQSENVKERDLARISASVSDSLNQSKQSYNNEKRNDLLSVKENIIDDVFQDALSQLEGLSGNDLLPFIEQALTQVDSNKAHTLYFGDKTAQGFSDDERGKLQEKNPQLTVSEETLKQTAGFIVEQDGIEYNYRFEDLITEIEPELKVAISQEVF